MPYLNCKLSVKKSQNTAKKVANMLLENTSKILKKNKDVTAINIEFISPECWFIGNSSVDMNNTNTFYLNIKVTDSTNTKQEKSQYIQKVFDDMSSILGTVSSTSYIVIEDIKSDSWGFGGKTQEYHFSKIKG